MHVILTINFQDIEDPFNMINVGRLIELYDLFTESLPKVKPYYAVKANSEHIIVKTLAGLGLGFDCASKVRTRNTTNVFRVVIIPDITS